MNKTILHKAALAYHKMGYSVIPLKEDKKPYIKWQPFQKVRADVTMISAWYQKWPHANVGIVCGEISGIMAVDADSEKGLSALNEYLPDSFLTPTSKTPKGYHTVFEYREGLSNGVRILADCDLRTTGGYIVAPPSKNGEGTSYRWLDGCNIKNVKPAPMPDSLFEVLRSGAVQADALTSANKNKVENPYINKSSSIGHNISSKKDRHNKAQHRITKHNIGFYKGQRDNSLFHVIWHLLKGGMAVEHIEIIAAILASNCNPPFEKKEIPVKIQSALDRAKRKNTNITQAIRDFIGITKGNISITECINSLQNITFSDAQKVRVIFSRLVKEGLLERIENQVGVYRIVDSQCEPVEWQEADTSCVNIWLPFELNQTAELQSGNIVVIAGTKDSGKTAVLLNLARENMNNYQVHYFSSEMGSAEFKKRVALYPYLTPKQWQINFYERAGNFADVIKGGEGNLYIVDFLEIYDNFYLIGKEIADIHKKLDGALAFIAIQKNPGCDTGLGGARSLEKARLYLSLEHGTVKCVSCKQFKIDSEIGNPRGMIYNFKILNGCELKKTMGWHNEIKEE